MNLVPIPGDPVAHPPFPDPSWQAATGASSSLIEDLARRAASWAQG